MNCSNCENSVGPEGLLVTKPGDIKNVHPVAAICETCLTRSITIKLILTRADTESDFSYEQFASLKNH